MRHTLRSLRESKRKTLRGGSVESVKQLILETPVGNVHIINPASSYVVVTYWWGRDNLNRNLQNPCREDILKIAGKEILAEIGREVGFPRDILEETKRLHAKSQTTRLSRPEVEYYESLRAKFRSWGEKKLEEPGVKERVNARYREIEPTVLEQPGSVKPRKFPEMITEWETYCEKAKVNYVSVNTEFPRSDYQNAINGKPIFIKKVLDAVKPRNVLYIDGDMWMLKYAHIFDLDNVDFMARGWNIDSRTKKKGLREPFFDPYTLETSGGTMFFGNTQAARDLLDKWEEESNKQVGKADDRILSQVFTRESMVVNTNIVQLPVEYLWLTDLYKDFLKTPEDASSHESAIIEHFYCLTTEEQAADQGAAASGRTPEGYNDEVIDNIIYNRPPNLSMNTSSSTAMRRNEMNLPDTSSLSQLRIVITEANQWQRLSNSKKRMESMQR